MFRLVGGCIPPTPPPKSATACGYFQLEASGIWRLSFTYVTRSQCFRYVPVASRVSVAFPVTSFIFVDSVWQYGHRYKKRDYLYYKSEKFIAVISHNG